MILIFVNIEIFTPWAMAAFGGAPNGKRVTSGTIKKLNPKLSIRHLWVQNPNGTKLTQAIVHSPTAVYVCSRFQMKPGLCETDPNSPDYTKWKNISAQRGASVYS